jgi:hypothetical protein
MTDEPTPSADPAPDATPLDTDGAAPDTTKAPDEDGEPAAASDVTELDDETLAKLAEGYKERLLATPEFQKSMEDLVRQQVERQGQEYQHQAQNEAREAALLQQGEAAVDKLFAMFEAAQTELGKAAREEEYTPQDGLLDVEQLETHLKSYGTAVMKETDGRYHQMFDRAAMAQLATLPTLTDEQRTEIRTVLNNAKRIQEDPSQGAAAAFAYSSGPVLGFLLARAREQAVAEERQRVASRSTVAAKVTDSVATKAAAAKLAAERGNTAPNDPPGAKTETASANGAPSQALYEQLSREGKHDEAQRVVDKMALLGVR